MTHNIQAHSQMKATTARGNVAYVVFAVGARGDRLHYCAELPAEIAALDNGAILVYLASKSGAVDQGFTPLSLIFADTIAEAMQIVGGEK